MSTTGYIKKERRKSLHQRFPLPREGADAARPHAAQSRGQSCSVANLNTDPKDCLCSACHQLWHVVLLLAFPSCSRKQTHLSFVRFHCHHLSGNCTRVLRLTLGSSSRASREQTELPAELLLHRPTSSPSFLYPLTSLLQASQQSDEMCVGTVNLWGGFRKDTLGSHLTRG